VQVGNAPVRVVLNDSKEDPVRGIERWFVAIALAFCVSSASAAEKPMTPQQQRMADCNKQASGKTGDDRKSFMSACLKGETPATPSTPQQRMKTCNADATSKGLNGDARKVFMSTCLKSDAAGASAH
jgi:hypothetical protein